MKYRTDRTTAPRIRVRRALAQLFPKAESQAESAAFHEHILSSVWNGISTGIFVLSDVILAKTLNAPAWQITLLATLGPAANLFSFYWAGQIIGRRKAGTFLLIGILGRLAMALLLLWPTTACMIILSFVYNIAGALMITALNAVFQSRYPERTRPVRYGIATSISALFAILSAEIAGALLQRREGIYPWLFAASGVAGFMGAWHLYRMERLPGEKSGLVTWLLLGRDGMRTRLHPGDEEAKRQRVRASFAVAARIFRENPHFVRFERDYMVYGFAFLSVLPILPIYIVHDLSMNYEQLSASKGLWALIGQVALSPVLGIALGRLRPLRFTGRFFLILALYPLCLLMSTFPGFALPMRFVCVYGALFFFSVAMAGVNMSWTLGSMHFAGNEDASAFQGLHVAMTGVRGLLAPSMGYMVYRFVGTWAVFALSTVLFTLAGILMLRHDRDDPEPGI
jgi:MFS family permease